MTKPLGFFGWLILAVAVARSLAVRSGGLDDVLPSPKGPSSPLPSKPLTATRRQRSGYAVVGSITLLAVAAAVGYWAFSLMPPDRAMPDPTSSLTGELHLSGMSLDELEVSLFALGSDQWVVIVRGHTEMRLAGGGRLSLELFGPQFQVLPCELAEGTIPPEHRRDLDRRAAVIGVCLEGEPEAGAYENGRGWVFTRLQSSRLLAQRQPSGDLVPSGSQVRAVIVLRASASDLGILEDEAAIKVATPMISTDSDDTSRRTAIGYTLSTPRGASMEWSGLTPNEVSSDSVRWSFEGNLTSPVRNLARGHDPRVDVQDQRNIFLAGALAGLAGGALLAALGEGATVLRRARAVHYRSQLGTDE